MPRTAKTTSALGTFGVYGPPSSDEREVLRTASEYRNALCEIYASRHDATIEHRNEWFPQLYVAMVHFEDLGAKIYRVEKLIKQYHSELRDRNALTEEQDATLTELREQRKEAAAEIKREKKPWLEMFVAFREHWRTQADWKNIKTLAKRRFLYEPIKWPNECIAAYGRLWMEHDLSERDLDRQFAPVLHSAIRAEIKEASKPKLKADGPGMRYTYGRDPQPRPWEKLTLQFSGGLPVGTASRSLSIEPTYTNHKASGDATLYDVTQQIGTSENPRLIKYRVKFHRDLPPAVIQRWSLVVRGDRRTVIPVCTNLDMTKPVGKGTFTYDLTWTVRKAGVEVAHFWGEHVNERLVIPMWLVARRLVVAEFQLRFDTQANEVLAKLGHPPKPNAKQGMEALAEYAARNTLSADVAQLLDHNQRDMHLVRKDAASAGRCIESIYKTVARRVCSLHDSVIHDTLDIARLKRYDTRDLLREDVVPQKSREILHAVSPGKLREALKSYGLAASDAVRPEKPGDARETELFTGYVSSLGATTGRKESLPNRRSQSDVAAVTP